MYKEDDYSKNLMKINASYKDNEHAEKKIMFIRRLFGQIKNFISVCSSILHIHKSGVGKVGVMIKAFLCPKTVQDHELTYSFDHTSEIDYREKGKEICGRVAVYTSIFGGYDTVLEPYYVSERCDYFIITDQEVPKGSVWKKLSLEQVPGFSGMDNYHKSKYCKMMPHVLFPEYEYSIWVDGNVQIVADMIPLVDRLNDEHVMGTFQNPLHDCIYTEKNIYWKVLHTRAVSKDKTQNKFWEKFVQAQISGKGEV